ncbi:MAG: phosphonopyruvate decarboxylase [Eubacterium sp.]|nr:phosphonopyruvate decarboxylase [Eubacterium sp.]MBR4240767.1 phosphonopyruvate decarboxylase [Eubacterium sp.]
MVNTKEFYDYLMANDVDFFTGVPDSLLANFCACVKENSPSKNNIIAANEGNAVAIASGYHIASGKYGVVYMQNSGQGNTVNPILSLADEDVYKIPMLLIIGWRGEPGKKDEPQHVKQGKVTLSLLECMGIDYQILGDNYKEQLETALNYMKENSKPYALVVQKGTFSDYKITKEAPRYKIKREEALEAAMNVIGEDDFIVSTTGKTSREIFEIRERRNQGHSHDFLTVGSMGHTASIALGMSIGSDKDIYCIDGDGSFIMHMGGMGIAAKNAGKNFKYILINNGAHESVGGQPTIGFDLDVEAILRASGFKSVYTAQTCDEVEAGVAKLREQEGAALIIYTNQGSREDLGRPTIAPEQNKINMMNEFSK